MQRVMIMGPPGSGKSTLARRLGAQLQVPVFHLDQIYWRSGWVEAPRDEFAAEVTRIAAQPGWVMDGNFISIRDSVPPRFSAADTLIYLDLGKLTTMPRILRRIARGHGQVRADMPEGCPEKFDLEFLRFAWTWNKALRARHLAVFESFAGERIYLRGPAAARRFAAG